MTEWVSALSAGNLVSCGVGALLLLPLQLLGQRVRMDGVCEGGPGRVVLVLLLAGEQRVATLATAINPRTK